MCQKFNQVTPLKFASHMSWSAAAPDPGSFWGCSTSSGMLLLALPKISQHKTLKLKNTA